MAGKTGTLIRLMRQAAGWTQQELADRSGYSQATISRLERGASRATRDMVILTDITQALGVPSAADSFSRNHISYTSHLGLVLIRRRQLDEAIAITSDALQCVDAVHGSGRIVARLKRSVDLLGQQDYKPAKMFATAACRPLPASL